AEGGRRTPPYNGIRWDFAYADDAPAEWLFMIWPDFFGADGHSLLTDQPLPVGVELSARMYVVADEMRAEMHRGRITPGGGSGHPHHRAVHAARRLNEQPPVRPLPRAGRGERLSSPDCLTGRGSCGVMAGMP